MWIQLDDFTSPIQSRTFAGALGQFRHDPRRWRARRFHLQDAARSQAGAAFIAVLNVERGPSDQPFLLPAKVKILASPNRRDQQNDAKKNAEQKSDDCSLCSFN